jgi:hypothetical protein
MCQKDNNEGGYAYDAGNGSPGDLCDLAGWTGPIETLAARSGACQGALPRGLIITIAFEH